ncbi:MAG: agmatinase [Planctomycetaceae bacterium]
MADSPFPQQPYQGIATFGRRPHTRELTAADVAILGVPYDGATSYRSGARFGPRAIREQSLLLWGYNNALGVAPFEALRVIDYGDVDVVPVDILATHRAIERDARTVVAAGTNLVTLGGDHSIALPLLRAVAAEHGQIALVHFDAHPDTWNAEFGDAPHSHGTPFRRAAEERLIETAAWVQVGIRGPTAGPQDYRDARALGSRLITLDELRVSGVAAVVEEIRDRVGEQKLYVTFDIDAVDPAFAPGTGTPEVGGLTSYEALQLVRGLAGLNVIGGDLVEVAPSFDHGGITAILAANLVFELLSVMALTQRTSPP